jgi:hypothetical protein
MEFISTRDAVMFLSQSAPAAWVYRALLWMAQSGEIELYADSVTVEARATIFDFIISLYDEAGGWEGAAMDAAIRKKYEPELAEKIIGKDRHSQIEDEIHFVNGWDSIGAIGPGFLLFSSKFDWQSNIMECDYIDHELLKLDWLFGSQDFVGSDFPNPDYTVRFSGLKFEANRIELLLPAAQLAAAIEKRAGVSTARQMGRPTKWDWDGAMSHVIAVAQTPDGLPTGHGAQAKIESMIAEWFEAETGNSPAISQIRAKASRIIARIEKA